MVLHKFTVNGKPIYIRLDLILAIEEFDSSRHAYSMHQQTNINYRTCLYMQNSPYICVEESVHEIIALLEGRDPYPAKVLFNSNGKV